MDYLIQNAKAIFTDERHDYTDLRISNGVITELGNQLVVQSNETVVDAKGCVVYPGFVNTHHHLAQSVLKGIPAGLNQGLGDWLASVPYRFWPKIDADLMYHAAKLGLYELLRSGATTCADHHYLYHRESSPEIEEAVWQAADDLGMRLVLCRGSATVQGSHRGMLESGIQPESIDQVLQRMQDSVSRHHQSSADAMKKVVVAPTSLIHSSVPEHLALCAEFARSQDLKLHSHFLEVGFDEVQAQEKYGMSAVDFAESVNWLGEDVWFAHLVKCDQAAIEKLAESKTAIAHCPTSNCRLGSGISPVIEMEKQGMSITLGVDGSASAESGSMIQELNLAWLIHRTQHGPAATQAEQVIKWGSENGARLLGLDNTGQIGVGKAADIVLYDIDQPRMAGVHSPLLAPILCAEPVTIKHTFIQGIPVWGALAKCALDEDELVSQVQQGVTNLLKKVQH